MVRACTLILLALATTAYGYIAPVKKTKAIPTRAAPHDNATSPAAHAVNARLTNTRGPVRASATKTKYVRKHGKLVRVSVAPSYQLHPDPERYQEIQQALTEKGYFKGEVNGQWGDDSVEALKRFQADQKLDDDGHLSALTLINLGLGPKHDHDLTAATPPAAISNKPESTLPSPTVVNPVLTNAPATPSPTPATPNPAVPPPF